MDANTTNVINQSEQYEVIENFYESSHIILQKSEPADDNIISVNEDEQDEESDCIDGVDEYYTREGQPVEFIESYIEENQEDCVAKPEEIEDGNEFNNTKNESLDILNAKNKMNSCQEENCSLSSRKIKKRKLSDSSDDSHDGISTALFTLGAAATSLAQAITGLAQALQKRKRKTKEK